MGRSTLAWSVQENGNALDQENEDVAGSQVRRWPGKGEENAMEGSDYSQRLTRLAEHPAWGRLEERNGVKAKDTSVYTASKLAAIGDCGWRYWLEYIKQVPKEHRTLGMTLGTAVHRAVNRMHAEDKMSDWLDIYREEWRTTLEDPRDSQLPWGGEVDEDTINKKFIDGKDMLFNYRMLSDTMGDVVGTEVDGFMLITHPKTKTTYRFAVRLDQIRRIGGELIYLDLKTDKDIPDWSYLKRSYQFTSYGQSLRHGVFEMPGGEMWEPAAYPDRMVWYHMHHLVPYRVNQPKRGIAVGALRGDPRIFVDRTPNDYEVFPVEACRLIASMRLKLFARRPNKWACKMCRYQYACTTGGQNANDIVSLADLSGLEGGTDAGTQG
jgi:hypothetical protein